MLRKLRLLKNLDLFGVPHKTQISLSEDEQKSLIGGLITAILYGLSLAYFIYVFIQWQSGKILPGFSSMIKAQSFSSYQFQKGELFQFTYYRYSQQLLDPFDPQNIILLPLGYTVTDGQEGEAVNLIANSNETSRYKSKLISPDGFQISQNVNASLTPDELPDIQYGLILKQCEETFLTQGQKCASQELVQEFWSSGVNYVTFWFKLRQFNILTKDIDMIEKEILFPLSNFTNTNGQFLFQPVNLNIDDGILFRNEEIKKFINDFKVVTSQTGMDFYQNILKYNTYMSFFMRVDPIIHANRVTYPKLDQILAEVGSISSTLLMIRVVIILINQNILEERLLKRIMRIYHPFIQFNTKEPSQLIKKFKQQAKKKLIITDIIEDIYNIKQFIEYRYGQNAIKDIRKQKFFESESSLFVRITPKTTFRQKSWG